MTKNIKEAVLEFLKENNTIVIATASPEGKPQAATVYYLVDDDFNIYFATGRETDKFKNLQSNKQAAFVVGTGPAVITVQGAGRVQEISDNELSEKGRIGAELYFKALKEWPVLKLPHGGLAFFKIIPDQMKFLNLDSVGHHETYQESYYQVI